MKIEVINYDHLHMHSDVTPNDTDILVLIFHNFCSFPKLLTFPLYETLLSCIYVLIDVLLIEKHVCNVL